MLRPEELPRTLERGIGPIYLIAGEEPLFVQEAVDAVRQAARAQGYTEREVLDAESGFEWGRLAEAAANLSLFGERRLIELRMPSGKPGQAGAKALAEYCQQAPQDVCVLISCGALDGKQRKSSWVSAIERAGGFCYAWPLPLEKLPGWVRERLRRHGLEPEPEAAALLAERGEGNLLAAAQEVEKLALLFQPGPLTAEQVAGAVADSARYSVFDLSDAVLEGKLARAVRIVQGLREEGVEPILVLWALTKELRALAELAARRPPELVFRQHKVFKQRQARLMQAQRRAPAAVWERLLLRAAEADRTVKGLGEGRPWDEVLRLTTAFAKVTNT